MFGDIIKTQGVLDYKVLKEHMILISKDEVGPNTLVSEADRVFAIIIFCLWYDLFFS
jgi:asparagine synthase (glutamine-hydrolysing)